MGDLIKKLKAYNPPILVDFIRIGAGGFLVYKGIIFGSSYQNFTANIDSVGWHMIAAHMGLIIIFVHVVGGSLLLLGGATRLMSLLNIPILIGAVILNYQKMLTVENYVELNTTVILLVVLLLVLITGSGRFSIERMRKRADEKASVSS